MIRLLAGVLAAGALAPAGVAVADSFTPVTIGISVAPIARRGAALPLRVALHADPGVLDSGGDGPMRMEVKLAPECGGDFQHTPGTVLMNLALAPQPSTGRAYDGTLTARPRPSAYGVQFVCAYLEDSTVGRVYANDESLSINVSAACTTAGQRYDAAARALTRAQRTLRRARGRARRARDGRLVAARRRALAGARRRGVAACGRGVTL